MVHHTQVYTRPHSDRRDWHNLRGMIPFLWEYRGRALFALGFLFLFMVSLLASALTVFMIRTGPRRGHSRGAGRRPPPEIKSPEENNPDLDLGDLK